MGCPIGLGYGEAVTATTPIAPRDGYVLFWAEWPSNWETSPFVLGGETYVCVEQYMMAEKARLFGDTVRRELIMASPHPRDHKRHGRGVTPYDGPVWEAARYGIVLAGTLEKYGQNAPLLELLLATGESLFAEASPTDLVWGIGVAADHPDATRPERWRGQNLLGKAIVEARAILRRELTR